MADLLQSAKMTRDKSGTRNYRVAESQPTPRTHSWRGSWSSSGAEPPPRLDPETPRQSPFPSQVDGGPSRGFDFSQGPGPGIPPPPYPGTSGMPITPSTVSNLQRRWSISSSSGAVYEDKIQQLKKQNKAFAVYVVRSGELDRENRALKAKIDRYEEKLEKSQNSVKEYKTRLLELEVVRDESNVQQKIAALEARTSQMGQMEQGLKTTSEQLQALSEVRENLVRECERYSQDSETIKIAKDPKNKTDETENALLQCKALESALSEKRLELQSSESLVQESKAALVSKDEENHKLQEERDKLKTEVEEVSKSYQNKLQEMSKQNDKLRQQVDDDQEKYNKISASLDKVCQEKAEIETELQNLYTNLAEMQATNLVLEQSIKERERAITKAKQDLGEITQDLKEADVRYKTAEDKLYQYIELEDKQRELSKQNEELHQQLDDTRKKYSETTAGLDIVCHEKAVLETELHEQNTHLAEMEAKNSILEQTIKAKESTVIKAKQCLEDISRKMEEATVEYKIREDKLHQYVQMEEDMKSAAEQDKRRHEEALVAAETSMENMREELEQKLQVAETELTQARTTNHDLVQKLKEAEKSRQDAEDEKCALKRKLEELQDSVSKAISESDKLELLVKDLKDTNISLRTDNLRLERVEGKMKDLKDHIALKLKENRQLQEERDKLTTELATTTKNHQQETKELSKQIARLQQQQKDDKEEYNDISAILDVVYKEKTALETELQTMKTVEAHLAELEQTMKERENTFNKVKQDLEESTRKVEKANSKYKSAENTIIAIRTDNLRLERRCIQYSNELAATVKACEDRERDLTEKNAGLKKEVEELIYIKDKYNEQMEIESQNLKLETRISDGEIEIKQLKMDLADRAIRCQEGETEIKDLKMELADRAVRCENLEEKLRQKLWEVDYARTVNDVKKEQQQILAIKLGDISAEKTVSDPLILKKVESLQIALTEKMGEVGDLEERLANAFREKALVESKTRQVEEGLQLRLAKMEEELANVSREKSDLSRRVRNLENTKNHAERRARHFKSQVAKMGEDSYLSEKEKDELKYTVTQKAWELTRMSGEKEKMEGKLLKTKQELSALIQLGTTGISVDKTDDV